MMDVNLSQRDFYDNKKKKGIASKIWKFFRGSFIKGFRDDLGLVEEVNRLQIDWMGDLTNKRVLDLGCYAGNKLSKYLAENSKDYLAIDLSERGISQLRPKIKKWKTRSARAEVMDFLSPEFEKEGKFDVIFVYSAMHHFKYFDHFLKRLDSYLNEGGMVVTYDPTETPIFIWLARRIYRPFQSDAKWEWPFNRSSYKTIEENFEIEKVQGFMGHSRRALIYYFIPISDSIKKQRLRRLHAQDLALANYIGKDLYRCMHVAMLLKKKQLNS